MNIQSAGDAGAVYCTGLIVYVVIDLREKLCNWYQGKYFVEGKNKRESLEILT